MTLDWARGFLAGSGLAETWMGEVHHERFATFDHSQLQLIEPLRALRMLNHAAWIAERWTDPAFPRAFPWFGEARYWEQHVLDLAEQGAALIDDPTGMG